MAVFFDHINNALIHFSTQLGTGFDDQKRRMMTDELGQAGSDYRTNIYNGFSGTKSLLDKAVLHDFLTLALQYVDRSIEANKRSDKLYHAYNLVTFTDDEITIRNLYEMLEGQVAVLSSGKLAPGETLGLLDALRISSLYRPDQESYILYPNKKLPLFLDKNLIPKEEVKTSKVLNDLVAMGDTSIINTDKKGYFHFNADFNNVSFLTAALNRLKATSGLTISADDQQAIEQLYERIFDHKSFTGRSGTFYKYEGLGCIYWHMVSKLLLAIGEGIQKAVSLQAAPETLNRLRQHYNAVQKGIGAHKSPADYGSFPFDPYSHTPMMAGVQQPGMTGQVKEDIINRFFELGMSVREGQLTILPVILNKDEFIQPYSTIQPGYTSPYLSFSYCSVPFVFLLDGNSGIDIHYQDRNNETIKGYSLSSVQSQAVFNRDPTIQKIIVHLQHID